MNIELILKAQGLQVIAEDRVKCAACARNLTPKEDPARDPKVYCKSCAGESEEDAEMLDIILPEWLKEPSLAADVLLASLHYGYHFDNAIQKPKHELDPESGMFIENWASQGEHLFLFIDGKPRFALCGCQRNPELDLALNFTGRRMNVVLGERQQILDGRSIFPLVASLPREIFEGASMSLVDGLWEGDITFYPPGSSTLHTVRSVSRTPAPALAQSLMKAYSVLEPESWEENIQYAQKVFAREQHS